MEGAISTHAAGKPREPSPPRTFQGKASPNPNPESLKPVECPCVTDLLKPQRPNPQNQKQKSPHTNPYSTPEDRPTRKQFAKELTETLRRQAFVG